MRINTDQVARTLERALPQAWLIAGDEVLLTGEAADLVRARARRDGFTGRELFVTDRGFDWSEVSAAGRSGQRVEGTDLVQDVVGQLDRVHLDEPTPEPGEVAVAHLRPDHHALAHRGDAREAQRGRVAGVETARHVGAGHLAQHGLVVAEGPAAEGLADVTVEVDARAHSSPRARIAL